MSFKEMLELDYKLLEKMLIPCSIKEMQKIQQNYAEKYLRYYIDKRLHQFLEKNPEENFKVSF